MQRDKSLDSSSTNMFLPCIDQQTRMLFNIISIYISQEIISRNLKATMSDQLPQFLVALHIFLNVQNKKTNILEWDWSKFNHEEVIPSYFTVDWSYTQQL